MGHIQLGLSYQHIISLHNELIAKTYCHSPYEHFNISDPKTRSIHKASVRDRLLHHAVYRVLYPFFDKVFIANSYSYRVGRGTHKAIACLRTMACRASRNHTLTLWVLKCDIRKFFASIDQATLIGIVKQYIPDQDTIWLISRITGSFYSTKEGRGLPLGNLTSQLLVNIYMNEFDQFAKHSLKARNYIRYADDFVIMSYDKSWLQEVLPRVGGFLEERLGLLLHPDKVSIDTLASGVDFLGWVHFPDHRVLRTVARRRMFRNLRMRGDNAQTVQSYLGLIGHGNAKKLETRIIG
ncbi:MAG: reverse transcriptase/maturase family protein [Patescibacteria group bacterium]